MTGFNEVVLIERHAKALERSDPIKNADQIYALVRGGIVLLSSHLEAYIKGIVEVTLEQFHNDRIGIEKLPKRALFYASQDLVREISQTNDPEKIAGKLLLFIQRDGNNFISSGPLTTPLDWAIFEQGFSTPKFKQIDRFLKRVGYTSLKADLGSKQGSRHPVIINAIDHLVDTRNSIAHGDQSERKTPSELSELSKNTREFCRDLDDAYCKWSKLNLCSIRR